MAVETEVVVVAFETGTAGVAVQTQVWAQSAVACLFQPSLALVLPAPWNCFYRWVQV